MEPQFEWSVLKAQLNATKHGVSFEEAASVFQDSFLITFFDEVYSEVEDRFISIGFSERQRLLLVIHTDRERTIRLISARVATRKERQTYELQSS